MAVVPSSASSSNDWEEISRALRRRSVPVANLLRTSKKKPNTCAALYATGIGCTEPLPPVEGARWCSRHNEERRKLYLHYKSHEALLSKFCDIPECQDDAVIMACDSLSLLRSWSEHLRNKRNLLARCILARHDFTRRFFGEDMDLGHKTYWEGLVQKRDAVDRLLTQIETRGYQLILRDRDALWVLQQEVHQHGDCPGDLDLPPNSDALIHTMESVVGATDDLEDPLEVALRVKVAVFKEKIRIYLAWFCTCSTSRFHDERLEVIHAYVRRAVYQDASLMFLSHSYDSVMALFSDKNLDLPTVEKLWRAINALCIHGIQSAVDDVVRSTDGDHVVILGGKVFKTVSGERWPLHAWGHMMAIRQCYSCLRRTCETIDQVIDLTRYALLTRAPLSQTDLKFNFSIDGCRELVLAGFITNNIPFAPARRSVAYKESGPNEALFEETRSNICLYAGLSLSDPMAQAFVNCCLRHPDFIVMVRKGDARVIRSSPTVWTSRKRYADTSSVLDSAPWEDVVSLSQLALEEAKPSGWGELKIAECMQIIIVDASEGTMSDFVQKLVQLWCQVYNVGDKSQLYDALKGPYDATGELEPFQKVTPELALDYYHTLWGCKPSPTLAEDPESFRF